MTVSGVGDAFASAAGGSLLLAAPVAALAGLISFASPCCLPLVPGYLSYVTGLSGATADETAARSRRTVLAGALLFVLGFSAVFVASGALFGALGDSLLRHSSILTRIFGVMSILMGVAFLGVIPMANRQAKLRFQPRMGVAGAPLLGVVFGLGWTPCLGPTLAVIQTLAFNEGTAARGALLTFIYSLGLGIPFIALALGFSKATRAVGFFRRHARAVTRIGGGLLILVGTLLVTGAWDTFTIWLRVHYIGTFTTTV